MPTFYDDNEETLGFGSPAPVVATSLPGPNETGEVVDYRPVGSNASANPVLAQRNRPRDAGFEAFYSAARNMAKPGKRRVRAPGGHVWHTLDTYDDKTEGEFYENARQQYSDTGFDRAPWEARSRGEDVGGLTMASPWRPAPTKGFSGLGSMPSPISSVTMPTPAALRASPATPHAGHITNHALAGPIPIDQPTQSLQSPYGSGFAMQTDPTKPRPPASFTSMETGQKGSLADATGGRGGVPLSQMMGMDAPPAPAPAPAPVSPNFPVPPPASPPPSAAQERIQVAQAATPMLTPPPQIGPAVVPGRPPVPPGYSSDLAYELSKGQKEIDAKRASGAYTPKPPPRPAAAPLAPSRFESTMGNAVDAANTMLYQPMSNWAEGIQSAVGQGLHSVFGKQLPPTPKPPPPAGRASPAVQGPPIMSTAPKSTTPPSTAASNLPIQMPPQIQRPTAASPPPSSLPITRPPVLFSSRRPSFV